MNALYMTEIDQEIARSKIKHKRRISDMTWERVSCILNEESGEVTKEVLDMTRGDDKLNPKDLRERYRTGLQRVYDEALQTAAVAIQIMDRCRTEAERSRIAEQNIGDKPKSQEG